MPVNTGQIQGNGQFTKGRSGNPKGKPKGARHRSSILAERLFADEVKDICQTVIIEAKAGNMQAAKIIMDRLFPPRKDNPIHIELPVIETTNDLLKATGKITDAVSSGQISPSEGEALARIIDIHVKAIELTEFETRLSTLEKARNESIE